MRKFGADVEVASGITVWRVLLVPCPQRVPGRGWCLPVATVQCPARALLALRPWTRAASSGWSGQWTPS